MTVALAIAALLLTASPVAAAQLYESKAIIEVRTLPLDDLEAGLAQEGDPPKDREARLQAEAAKVRSPEVLKPAIETLSLTETWDLDMPAAIERVQKMLSVEPIPDSDQIAIVVRAPDAELAKSLCTAVSEAFAERRRTELRERIEQMVDATEQRVREQEKILEEKRRMLDELGKELGLPIEAGGAAAEPPARGLAADSPVEFPEQGALPAKYPPDLKVERFDPGEDGYYLFRSPQRSLAQVKEIQAAMPKGSFTAPPNDWKHLERTRRLLSEGGKLHIMAIGDSIVNDTMRSGWVALLREAYPDADITATGYVRGGGGCQHFKKEQRLEKHVIPRQPDLVFLGGISQRDIESVAAVIDRLRADLPEVEFLLGTGAFGTTDPRDPAALAAAAHSGTSDYGRQLAKLAAEKRSGYLDFTAPWAEYIRSSTLHPHRFYRDPVHANEFGEQILAKILMSFWTADAE